MLVSIRNGAILAYVLSGCGGEPTDTSPTATSTIATSTTTETAATGTSTGTTTTKPDKWDGWEMVDSDTEGYDLYGYVLETWQVGPKAENYFQTNLGTERTFYLLRPQETPLEEVNLLVSLHGGAVDDDSAEDYYTEKEDPFQTKCGLAQEVSIGFAAFRHLQIHEIMTRGWAQVVPVNLWCDFWVGRGEDDPVDQENHMSYVHVSETLDFLLDGAGGFDVADLYIWGNSSGGAAAIPLAHWYDGVDGVVSDSPPCKMEEYYYDDQSSLKHIFGGRPFDGLKETEFIQNYRDVSCDWLVASGGYDVPTYVTYNVRDALTGSYSPEAFAAAADAVWPSAGVRYGYHDLDHDSPGLTFHTQTRSSDTIGQYTTVAMFSFLEGATVKWAEAEAGCSTWPCDVGSVLNAKKSPMEPVLKNSSKSSAIVVRQASGAGVAYTGRLPEDYADGETLKAVFVLEVEGLTPVVPDSDVLLTISYENDSGVIVSQNVTAGDIVTDIFVVGKTVDKTKERHQRHMKQYSASSLSFTVQDPKTSRLTVSYTGAGEPGLTIYIDAIQYIQ
jgi:hypothetical protein